ncbi:MAG: ABC transporter permease [Clostridiales bacterium]|nr:ABC transporter permease [Clostridiales bacterium]
MKLRDAAGMSASNLRKNPVRTLLTILGLGVGIAAVLTVLTLGSAGEEQVEFQIARLGVDKVWVTPLEENELEEGAGKTITASIGAPACAGAYTMSAVRLADHAALAQVNGYDAGMEAVHSPQLTEGRLFSAGEYAGSPVALVDEALAEELGGNVLGMRIDVGSRKVRIVGIVSGVNVQAASATQGVVIVPLRTFLDTYASAGVSEVTVSVPRDRQANEVGSEAVAALGEGFQASSLQEEIDAARSVVRIFVMVLGCVAAVCMVTGGIGVMNILLVSVRERRREIGLIKAIGGTARQVGTLFLLEAVCYALLGGLLGVVMGMAMIRLFGLLIGLEARMTLGLAVPAVLTAGGLGVVFGVAPALRAAGMLPVDALKTE